MQHTFMMVLLMLGLYGCAQSGNEPERPSVKGAYLVIEGRDAWAVLVDGADRYEEHGFVVSRMTAKTEEAGSRAAYVVQTPNCGEVQWLPGSAGSGGSGGVRLFLPAGQDTINAPGCILSRVQAEGWTALDYSS